MSDMTELATRYIALWNERDPQARAAAIKEIWAEDGSYVDPLAQVEGQDGIEAVVAGAQAQFPGYVFRLGTVDEHHDIARFTWELAADADSEALVIGFDVAVRAADGRIQSVYGFLDKVPA